MMKGTTPSKLTHLHLLYRVAFNLRSHRDDCESINLSVIISYLCFLYTSKDFHITRRYHQHGGESLPTRIDREAYFPPLGTTYGTPGHRQLFPINGIIIPTHVISLFTFLRLVPSSIFIFTKGRPISWDSSPAQCFNQHLDHTESQTHNKFMDLFPHTTDIFGLQGIFLLMKIHILSVGHLLAVHLTCYFHFLPIVFQFLPRFSKENLVSSSSP